MRALEELTLHTIGNESQILHREVDSPDVGINSTTWELRKKKKLSLQQVQQRIILINDCYARAAAATTEATATDDLNSPTAATGSSISRCTERDLYYMHPAAFPSQAHLTSSIRGLCDALNETTISIDGGSRGTDRASSAATAPSTVNGSSSHFVWTRSALGIDATAKAILVGVNTIIRLKQQSSSQPALQASCEEVVHLRNFGPCGLAIGTAFVDAVVAISLPQPASSMHRRSFSLRDVGNSAALLVVEKESTLRHLLSVERLWDTARHWTFLCTKGFPCAASKSFLRVFHHHHPEVPIVVLCDADVFGVHIAWCLARTTADDRSWYEHVIRRSARRSHGGGQVVKRSGNAEPTSTLMAADTMSYLSESGEWGRFISFLGSMRFLGLTSAQAATLASQSDLTTVPQSEVSRAVKLRTELLRVQSIIVEYASFACAPLTVQNGDDVWSPKDELSGAVATMQQFLDAVDGLLAFKRKAELQCLSRHRLGTIGALLSFNDRHARLRD
jgi:hypothetical protein